MIMWNKSVWHFPVFAEEARVSKPFFLQEGYHQQCWMM
jgi:hypothetical protein